MIRPSNLQNKHCSTLIKKPNPHTEASILRAQLCPTLVLMSLPLLLMLGLLLLLVLVLGGNMSGAWVCLQRMHRLHRATQILWVWYLLLLQAVMASLLGLKFYCQCPDRRQNSALCRPALCRESRREAAGLPIAIRWRDLQQSDIAPSPATGCFVVAAAVAVDHAGGLASRLAVWWSSPHSHNHCLLL